MSSNEPEPQENVTTQELSEDLLGQVSGGNGLADFTHPISDHDSLNTVERHTGLDIDGGIDANGNRTIRIG